MTSARLLLTALSVGFFLGACTTRKNPEFCERDSDCEAAHVCNTELHTCEATPDAAAPPDASADASPTQQLMITRIGDGDGLVTVRAATGDEECASSTCVLPLAQDADIVVEAAPAVGSSFAQWSGDCTGHAGCSLTLDTDKSITVEFVIGGAPSFGRQVGDPSTGESVTIHSVAFDTDGNILVAGEASGSVTIAGSFVMTQEKDLFVAKYTAAGSPLWTTNINGTFDADDFGNAVVADANGNAYVVGQVDNSEVIPSPAGDILVPVREAYVAKLDRDSGDVLWSRELGSVGFSTGYDVAVDAVGNIVVAGGFFTGISFDGVDYTSAGEADGFVAWIGPDNSDVSFQAFGTAGTDFASDIAIVAETGDVVAVGITDSPGNGFIAVFSSAGGSVEPLREFVGDVEWISVATGNQGTVYLAGTHTGAVNFGGVPAVTVAEPPGASALFIASFDSDGAPTYAVSAGRGTGGTSAQRVTLNDRGDLVVAGRFTGDVDFGDGSITGVSTDGYLTAFSEDTGAFRWKRIFAAASLAAANAIAADADGNLLAGGEFMGTVDIADELTCNGARCGWFGRYGP